MPAGSAPGRPKVAGCGLEDGAKARLTKRQSGDFLLWRWVDASNPPTRKSKHQCTGSCPRVVNANNTSGDNRRSLHGTPAASSVVQRSACPVTTCSRRWARYEYSAVVSEREVICRSARIEPSVMSVMLIRTGEIIRNVVQPRDSSHASQQTLNEKSNKQRVRKTKFQDVAATMYDGPQCDEHAPAQHRMVSMRRAVPVVEKRQSASYE